MSKYHERLKDPRWQRKRLEVMQRDGFKCLACGDDRKTLNVHHKSYANNPWETSLEDLETLCEICHKYRTKINKIFERIPTSDVLNYLEEFIILTPDQLKKFYNEVIQKPRDPLDNEDFMDYCKRMRRLERQWFGDGYER